MKIAQRYRKLNLWSKFAFWGSICSILGFLYIFWPSPPTKARIQVNRSPNTVVQTTIDSPNSLNVAAQNLVLEKPPLAKTEVKTEIRSLLGRINPQIIERIDRGETSIPVLINTINLHALLQLSGHSAFQDFLSIQGDGSTFHGVNRGGIIRVGNHLDDQNQSGTLDGYVLAARPELRSDDKERGPAVSQSMLNSPGGVQAAGNLTITSDRRLIQAAQIRLSIDSPTPRAKPTDQAVDMGLRSAIAIFTTNKTRIRFVSDFRITDQQIAEDTRRLTFDYSPESPGQIQGQDISFLAQIDTLAVNYSDIFKQEKFLTNREAARMTMALTVNGIELFSASIEPEPGALAEHQVNLSVAQLFKTASEIYDAKVSQLKTHP